MHRSTILDSPYFFRHRAKNHNTNRASNKAAKNQKPQGYNQKPEEKREIIGDKLLWIMDPTIELIIVKVIAGRTIPLILEQINAPNSFSKLVQ